MEGRVGIVILNWNNHEDTLACVASLRASSAPIHELVIVDNGSRDDSRAVLEKEFLKGAQEPFRVELIFLERNIGFTGGVNVGLNYLKERVDAFWLLNNDVTVDPDALRPLAVAVFEFGHDIATSKILVAQSDPPKLWYGGASLADIHIHSPLRGREEVDRGQYDRAEFQDYATGCSLFFSRRALDRVGLLDEIFFAYGEDADWCFRAREAGLSIYYEPASVIWHGVSRSTRDQNEFGGLSHPLQYYLNVRSRLILIRRYVPWWKRPFSLAYFLAPYPAIMLYNFLRGRRVKAGAVLRGIFDGFRSTLAREHETNEQVVRRIREFQNR